MPDYYHAPALLLTALLLPAFAYLYLRFRDTRTLLWFLGFLLALISMVLRYSTGAGGFWGDTYPWLAALGQTCTQVGTALFLGSLSPQRFRIGRLQVLYAIPYASLLVVYSILFYGVFHGVTPRGPMSLVFPFIASIVFMLGLFWSGASRVLPVWLGVSFCSVLGGLALLICVRIGPDTTLTFAVCANLLMTAVVLLFVFRRFSPGVFLSVLGFLAWSLSFLRIVPWVALNTSLDLNLIRVIVMGKVVAAVGMLVLVLEDELNSNKVARERERSVRSQLEAYANLILTRRRVEDFDRQGADICETVVNNSRFTQAALLLEHSGRYRLAGSAALEMAIARPLGELAKRIPVEGFLAPGSAPAAVEHSKTLWLDLTPWLLPGDDLERLRYTSVLAVPMLGRSGVDGALLLRGMRVEDGLASTPTADAPRLEDLLPVEMLVARLQATRSQTMLFEKLIDSERFAGLGQLAGNVTQQLNSPLTVILGYASLLEDSRSLDAQDRKAAGSIVNEARCIRSTLESLSRVSHTHADEPAALSVSELLADMEQLYRPEFLQRSIEFQINVAPGLPRILCGAQQLRQALLHCLQYAIGAVEREGQAAHKESKTIRLEAAREGNLVQISVSHSGLGFLHPERAFDPFVPARAGGETAGTGLSLCATILRDQNGRASAVNLEPRGAAIILELQAA
jgi:two-component system NtrC family sensor kinase